MKLTDMFPCAGIVRCVAPCMDIQLPVCTAGIPGLEYTDPVVTAVMPSAGPKLTSTGAGDVLTTITQLEKVSPGFSGSMKYAFVLGSAGL